MILGSVFHDVAVIRQDRTILRDQCGFPYLKKKIKTKTSTTASPLFCQRLNYKLSNERQV